MCQSEEIILLPGTVPDVGQVLSYQEYGRIFRYLRDPAEIQAFTTYVKCVISPHRYLHSIFLEGFRYRLYHRIEMSQFVATQWHDHESALPVYGSWKTYQPLDIGRDGFVHLSGETVGDIL